MGWGTQLRADPIGLLDDLADAVDEYLAQQTDDNFARLTAARLRVKQARTMAHFTVDI